MSISLFEPRPDSVAQTAIEYTAVTERVALGVARLEGILAAAAVKCLGGEMPATMWPTQRSQVEKLKENGLEDPERKLTLDDLVRADDVIFAATGITPGETLNGVRYFRGGGRTHSVVMCTEPRMIRFTDTIHALEPGAGIQGFQL